jgi:hypothetical protein
MQSKMKLQSLIYLVFLTLSLPPSVKGQHKSYVKISNCRQIISLDLGAHSMSKYDTYGANISLTIENIIQKHFSISVSFKEFVDKSGIFYYDLAKNPLKELIAHRVGLQTGISYYPKNALHGFYIGGNFGGLILLNTNGDQPLVYDRGIPKLSPAFETMTDMKLGFQGFNKYGFTWNVYIGAGVIFPSQSKPYSFGEAGFKVGKKL